MDRCVSCNHQTNSSSHDKCRTHADCARNGLYYGAFCGICHSLWGRAREYEVNPVDASRAFDLLLVWTSGFAKNSKDRPPGTDFFADIEERRDFERLRSILKPRKRASSLDSRRSSVSSKRVSIMEYFFWGFFLFLLFLMLV